MAFWISEKILQFKELAEKKIQYFLFKSWLKKIKNWKNCNLAKKSEKKILHSLPVIAKVAENVKYYCMHSRVCQFPLDQMREYKDPPHLVFSPSVSGSTKFPLLLFIKFSVLVQHHHLCTRIWISPFRVWSMCEHHRRNQRYFYRSVYRELLS